jgi:hypothetical protein
MTEKRMNTWRVAVLRLSLPMAGLKQLGQQFTSAIQEWWATNV